LKEIGFFPNLVVERMVGCEGRESRADLFFLLKGRVCFDFSFDFDEFFNFCSWRAIEQRGNVFSLKSYLDFVLIFQKRQITIIVGEGGHIIIMVCGSVMFLVNSRIGTQPSFKFPFINIRRESLFLL